ncbi:MAG: hypothetical protein ACFCD0_03595 [Gemmataceae bacterium]
MSDRTERNPYALPEYGGAQHARREPPRRQRPRKENRPVPKWLASRLLRPDEEVVWATGPRHTPAIEPILTHWVLVVVGLLLGVGTVLVGLQLVNSLSRLPMWSGFTAIFLVFGSVMVVAAANGYFTRLIATNKRVFIVQGQEVCRSWGLSALPRSLVQYRMNEDGEEERSINVDALKTMLDAPGDGFAESKTILSFGKHLDRVKDSRQGNRD